MIKLISTLFLLIIYNFSFCQIVPYLWTENLILKKEKLNWVEKITTVFEREKDIKNEYPLSKIIVGESGDQKIVLFKPSGEIKEVNTIHFPDEFTSIFEMDDGNKEITKYDKDENIISETWIYPFGSKDEKQFIYKNGKLVEIIEKDEFGEVKEQLVYQDSKLVEIKSIDEYGEVAMVRKWIYDKNGKISEMQRIQEGTINLTQKYSHDQNDRLILKQEERMHRIRLEKMPPETYTYEYFEDGSLKEEKWIIYLDETKQNKTYESYSVFNKLGLKIKEVSIDYVQDAETITSYKYKMKN